MLNEWFLVFTQPLEYSALWSNSEKAHQVELRRNTISLLHYSSLSELVVAFS